MKVIFLDIDGVICTLRSHLAFGRGLLLEAWDITSCHLIKKLCKEFDFKIIVSSTWRLGRAHDCKMQLSIYGLGDYVWGEENWPRNEDWKTERLEGIRGNEIDEWLFRHPEVTQYIILDDDFDFHEHQKPFLIQTDCNDGFSSKDYLKIKKMFGDKNDM